jgi:hypothetical protein
MRLGMYARVSTTTGQTRENQLLEYVRIQERVRAGRRAAAHGSTDTLTGKWSEM